MNCTVYLIHEAQICNLGIDRNNSCKPHVSPNANIIICMDGNKSEIIPFVHMQGGFRK